MKQWSIQTCPRSVHPDWSLMSGPSRTETLPCPWCALGTFPADHPSTVYRPGDLVEVTPEPIRGTVNINSYGAAWCVDPDGSVVVGAVLFADAITEGRVRLVKAAAPTYEPGVYWSPSLDRNFLYVPGLSKSPFIDMFDGSRVAAADLPDLVPCDVVPRG